MWSADSRLNPALLIATTAPVLGCLPRNKFVSMQPGQRDDVVTVLCASAALIPAINASPAHHFQSLYQRLGLGSACARLAESSAVAINIAMRTRGLMRASSVFTLRCALVFGIQERLSARLFA